MTPLVALLVLLTGALGAECGNGICEGYNVESCKTCPADCGTCEISGYVNSCYRKDLYALSFENGPSIYTPYLLDILKERGVPATFFIEGIKLETPELADIAKRAFDEGHTIGSYMYSSEYYLTSMNVPQVDEDATRFEALYKTFIGGRPKFLRPKNGESYWPVQDALERRGYILVNYNLDTRDETFAETQPDTIVQVVENGIKSYEALNMSILHRQSDMFNASIARVPQILDLIEASSYRLVSMAQCLQREPLDGDGSDGGDPVTDLDPGGASDWPYPVITDVVTSCMGGGKFVFAFEGGPYSTTGSVVDFLEDYDVNGTIFVTGAQLQSAKNREVLKAIHATGRHTIGISGWSGENMMLFNTSVFEDNIVLTERIIYATIGIWPRFFRPPYGQLAPLQHTYMNQRGYTVVHWNVDPQDDVYYLNNPGMITLLTEQKVSQLKFNGESGILRYFAQTAASVGQLKNIYKTVTDTYGYETASLKDCLMTYPVSKSTKGDAISRTPASTQLWPDEASSSSADGTLPNIHDGEDSTGAANHWTAGGAITDAASAPLQSVLALLCVGLAALWFGCK